MESAAPTTDDLRQWIKDVVIDEAMFVLDGRVGVDKTHTHLCKTVTSETAYEAWHRCYDYMCVQTYAVFADAVHSKLQFSVSRDGKRISYPSSTAAAISLCKRQHLQAEQKSQELDIAAQLRRLAQDVWFPVHNFADKDNTLVWSRFETHVDPTAAEKEIAVDRMLRADALFQRNVNRLTKYASYRPEARVMCHLTKQWRQLGEMESITAVLEGDATACKAAVNQSQVQTRFRRRPDKFVPRDVANHPDFAKSDAVKQENSEKYGELTLTITLRRTYVRFLKTLFAVVHAQQSVRCYLRRNSVFDDCKKIVAGDADALEKHAGVLLTSLLDGRAYVINNCSRLKQQTAAPDGTKK